MGTFAHTAVIVTMSAEGIIPVHALATQHFGALATPICPAPNNGFASFAVLPCGSKLGWDAEQNHRDAIAAFLAKADLCWDQFAVVAFGDCAPWAGKGLPTNADLELF